MVHRFETFTLAAFVILSSTMAFAQDVAPDAAAPVADAPPAESPVEGTDPAGEAPPEPIESTDPAASEPADSGEPNANDAAPADGADPTDEKAPAPPPEADEPMGGLASYAIAYGVGVATMGIMHGLVSAGAALSVATSLFGAAIAPIAGPVGYVLNGLSFLACCFLPAGQGALINLVGDSVTGSEPSLAYLWTILASYVSCYAFSCVGALAYGAVIFAVAGAAIAAFFTGQPIPGGQNLNYLFAGSVIGIFGVVAVAQPLIPAGVYVATRDTGESNDEGEDYVDTDDEYVRAPKAPGARPEIALGAVRSADMAF
jgi:hypothetical protein